METIEEKLAQVLKQLYDKYSTSIIYINFNQVSHIIKIYTSYDKNAEILATFKKMTKDMEHDYKIFCE